MRWIRNYFKIFSINTFIKRLISSNNSSNNSSSSNPTISKLNINHNKDKKTLTY